MFLRVNFEMERQLETTWHSPLIREEINIKKDKKDMHKVVTWRGRARTKTPLSWFKVRALSFCTQQ